MKTVSEAMVVSSATVTPEVDVFAWTEWGQVKDRWTGLADNWAVASLFLTTEWVETWLAVFGPQLKPDIVFFRESGVDFAACLLVSRTERRGPVMVTRLYLNTAGEDEADEIFIENNNLLCRRGKEEAAAEALISFLAGLRWDELVLDGCADHGPILRLLTAFPGSTERCQTRPDYYIDLDAVRASGKPYENAVSSKMRSNIRQNLKAYEAKGEIQIRFASDAAEAQQMLDKLAEIHQRRWAAKSLPGVFASPQFCEFHRRWIAETFHSGRVDLVEVSVAGITVGMLYNFVFDNAVAFYQCGFEYTEERRLSPGQLTLFMAIREYLARGRSEFDFMAGDTDYKRWMSTNSRELSWVVVERPGWKRKVLDSLRVIKKRYVLSTAPSSAEGGR